MKSTRMITRRIRLGPVFEDMWQACDKALQDELAASAIRYYISGEIPQDISRVGVPAWAAVLAEINRIKEFEKRLTEVRHSAGKAGANARWNGNKDASCKSCKS